MEDFLTEFQEHLAVKDDPSTSSPSRPRAVHEPYLVPMTSRSDPRTHAYLLHVPLPMWERIVEITPDKGIRAFLLDAVAEKIAQPNIPVMVQAITRLLPVIQQYIPTTHAQDLQDLQAALEAILSTSS